MCTRCWFTMTNMIQVWSSFQWARVFFKPSRSDEDSWGEISGTGKIWDSGHELGRDHFPRGHDQPCERGQLHVLEKPRFHVATPTMHKLGFNQNYYRFACILLIKIVMRSKISLNQVYKQVFRYEIRFQLAGASAGSFPRPQPYLT